MPAAPVGPRRPEANVWSEPFSLPAPPECPAALELTPELEDDVEETTGPEVEAILEPVPFVPAAPRLPRTPRRPVERWSRITLEKGVAERCACDRPGETLFRKTKAPATSDNASASRNKARAQNRSRFRHADARSRRSFKLATAAPSAAKSGIREHFGMKAV